MDPINAGDLTQIILYSGFISLFLPYLISLVNQPTWSPQLRGLVTMVIYGLTGVGVAYWQGQLDQITDLFAAIVPIFLVSSTKYHFLDKPSLLAPKLEYITSRRPFDYYAEDKIASTPKPVAINVPENVQLMKP